MILSMTGFGRAEGVFEGKKVTVDLKSLNSKSFDLNIKIPPRYREKEFDIRKKLNDAISRGKVDCYINYEIIEGRSEVKINSNLVRLYIDDLRSIADDAPEFEYLKMAIRMPDVLTTNNQELDEAEWDFLYSVIDRALENFVDFRVEEGKTLHDEFTKNINEIESKLKAVPSFEEERIQNIKDRYEKSLKEFENIDETRYYQEISFFVERLDVSEEKVRLAQHLKYFCEVMTDEEGNGKKLGFISQEIGREINTLGSKANHSEIQKLVVEMKDHLEKIKEQTLNVL